MHKKIVALFALVALVCGAMFADVAVKALDGDNVEVTFTIKAPASQLVVITGPSPYFPNWSPDGIPMTKGDDGVWSYTLTAKKSDEIVYKFLLDGAWLADPNAPETTDDGFGGRNGVVTIASLVGGSSVAAGPKIRFKTNSIFGLESNFNTANGEFKANETKVNSKSYLKFDGEYVPGMTGFTEIELLPNQSVVLQNADKTKEFKDTIPQMFNDLVAAPISWLNNDTLGNTKFSGLKLGFNSPWVTATYGYKNVKLDGHSKILWTTVDGEEWNAGYDVGGGYTMLALGKDLKNIGDVAIDAMIAPTKNSDRKGNNYGLYTYFNADWNGWSGEIQYNGGYGREKLFKDAWEHDIIVGVKKANVLPGLNIAAQGLFAIHPMSSKDILTKFGNGNMPDFLGYSSDALYRSGEFKGIDNMALDVKASYASDLFDLSAEYKLRGLEASMLFVRENHDDAVWHLSDMLGLLNSQNIIVNGAFKGVENLKIGLEAKATMGIRDVTDEEVAEINSISNGYYSWKANHNIYVDSKGAELEFKPSVSYDLSDVIGYKSSIDGYVTLNMAPGEFSHKGKSVEEGKYSASDGSFLFKNAGLKFSMGELNDIIKGIDVYYGLNNSDSARLFNTLIGSVYMPSDIRLDATFGIRNTKGTDAGKILKDSKAEYNAFGLAIGAHKKLTILNKPWAYLQFIYNVDPYKGFSDGHQNLNLDGYNLDAGVGSSENAAAIRLGVYWDF